MLDGGIAAKRGRQRRANRVECRLFSFCVQPMIQLNLYGTLGCHLCDAALAELAPLMTDVQVNQVDIVDSNELMERYQLRIPVLQRVDSGAELDWPFDLASLMAWLGDSLREEG
jgi:glutaredoxin-like protein DUF836|tara:strand:- start:1963 stop:2304 length:342 start_codon:yes stop_codon:yes gene_type:complete